MEPFVRPTVSPGDALRIVAPSGPFDEASFEEGLAFLRTRYEVRVGEGIRARRGYLAGDDARRLAELRDALDEPDTRAILCARGGYGATRLLESLSPEHVRRASKLLVGFSDITALHALWARAGVASLHGPMVAWLGRAPHHARHELVTSLEDTHAEWDGLTPMRPGRVEGVLLGGNLAVLAALVGTPYAPPLDGAILFLEEVGEAPYRVDRWLTQLRHAGWLAAVRGVVLGDFVRCHPGDHGVPIEDVLADRLGDLDVPVVRGLPAGHGDQNAALPFGRRVVLDADEGTLTVIG